MGIPQSTGERKINSHKNAGLSVNNNSTLEHSKDRNCIQLAQVKVEWRAFGMTLMNRRLP
jgi:hypothetical protein